MDYKRENIMKRFLGITLVLILIFTSTQTVEAMQPDKLYVYYLSTGSSDCILIELNGKYMLVDTSYRAANSKSKIDMITKFLHGKKVKELEYVVITHYDGDHIGGLNTIVKEFKVKKFISRKYSTTTLTRMNAQENKYPYQNYIKMINAVAQNGGSTTKISSTAEPVQVISTMKSIGEELSDNGTYGYNWIFPKRNSTLKFDEATLTFMHKDTTYIAKDDLSATDFAGRINNDSIVFRLEYKGKNFLFLGDLGIAGRRNFMSGYGGENGTKFDVFKASHHGTTACNRWKNTSESIRDGYNNVLTSKSTTIVTTANQPQINSSNWETPIYSTYDIKNYVNVENMYTYNYMGIRIATTGIGIEKKAVYMEPSLGTISFK